MEPSTAARLDRLEEATMFAERDLKDLSDQVRLAYERLAALVRRVEALEAAGRAAAAEPPDSPDASPEAAGADDGS